ncbi:MAG: DUF2961 domain-containing protein [Clostridia bacterium]|nr:DUF2961 domain-containing protein [Clostridia bacterium]
MNYMAKENLCVVHDAKRKRISSYDRTGGNDDRVTLQPGQTYTFAEIDKPGCITHIWMTMETGRNEYGEWEKNGPRKIVLRMYWDGEECPSVEAPVGDFFGMGHGITKNFTSAPLQMAPQDGKAFNSWWPMCFNSAKLTITNECVRPVLFYFYVDYEEYKELPNEAALRFHAKWHRECPTKGKPVSAFKDHLDWCHGGKNIDGKDNYVILEAEGRGHYCGCNINIHNLSGNGNWDWPGEGDDMIFIDGDKLPSLNGTGTEDYVNMAWCPQQEFQGPYHGLLLGGQDNWKGKITYYRYHIADPVYFEKSIKVTIEHGHNNNRSDDWSTTAYWYQTEPHKRFEELLPVQERMPVDEGELILKHSIVFTNKNF